MCVCVGLSELGDLRRRQKTQTLYLIELYRFTIIPEKLSRLLYNLSYINARGKCSTEHLVLMIDLTKIIMAGLT